MKDLKQFIKTTIREFLNENTNLDFKYNALQFIKDYLNIKSEIILKHTTKIFDTESMTQQMASVGFSDNKYTININFNDTKFGFVRRLSHELVHVKQMEEGRLKIIDNEVYFDGNKYTYDDYQRLYHTDEIPKFEEEAFEQERIIANLYWNK